LFENFYFSLRATMPLFIMMVLGYFLKRIGLINKEGTKSLNLLVFRVFLPLLLFKDLAEQDFYSMWDTTFVVFCFVATIISIGIAAMFSHISKNRKDRGEIIQASYRSAAATLGIAFMANIYNDVSMVALMIIGSVPLYNIAAVIVLSVTSPDNDALKDKKELAKKTMFSIITNPILIGVVLGTLGSLMHLQLTPIVGKTVNSLAAVASPLALIALGSSFKFDDLKAKYKPVLLVIFNKLFLFCVIFLPLGIYLGFRNEKLVAALIMLGSASTSSCYVMSKSMGHEGIISSAAVMIGTLLSSATLTFWLFALKSMGFI